MSISARNVVAGALLIPTTVLSVILSFLVFVLASVGAPLSLGLGVLTVVWAANIAMWRLFLHALRDKYAGSTQPLIQRLRYYLVLSAALGLIGIAFTDPVRDVWASGPLGWMALTLIYFFAVVFLTPSSTAAFLAQTRD